MTLIKKIPKLITMQFFSADGEGCVCPEDWLLLGDKCVPPDQCGCVWKNKRYAVSRYNCVQ